MRISYDYVPEEFSKAQLIAEQKIAKAATGAVREAAELAKQAGRAAIAAGGFSSRWQNALRAKVYPQSGYSIDAAAFIWHKIPYAGVFETGATIQGHPLLWLPLKDAPIGRGGKAMAPADVIAGGGKLVSINRPGKAPILAAVVTKGRGKRHGSGGLVPLYVGVPQVTEPQKFDATDAIKEVGNNIAELYVRHFEE